MSALVKIRSERDRMSAIERRIADFVLDNAQLLRDYSSQQLANALGISQSSVVKFCQKLGFKGYPDLKLSISEAVVRADNGNGGAPSAAAGDEDAETIGADLWLRKTEAEQATRLINPPDAVEAAAGAIAAAGKVFIIGLGDDDIQVNPTAVRVPVFFGHSEAVAIETRDKVTAAAARELLERSPGIEVVDERKAGGYPTPVTHASGNDPVYVGRIREDISHPRGLNLWIVSDNIRKGAALNAVQLAELVAREG